MSKFYTGRGDDGYTGLIGKGRVPKYHPRLEAVGSLDEASAALGIARATSEIQSHQLLISTIQRDLYKMMAEISSTKENASKFRSIGEENVNWLEKRITEIGGLVKPQKEFILPGDSRGGAAFALARTIARRAERKVCKLFHDNEIENPRVIQYLNRLSSFCFLLELLEYKHQGVKQPTLAKDD